MNNSASSMMQDHEEIAFHSDGQDWIVTWHPATQPAPPGKAHGSAAVCLTSDRHVVLVRGGRETWSLPAGRPEGDEDWRATLDREMLEEACATVEEATLLGFSKGVCIRGHEEGLVLVRALWLAQVSLGEWEPQFEIKERLVLPPEVALERVTEGLDPNLHRFYVRFFHEALK